MPPYLWLALLLLGVAFLLRVDFIFYILYVLIGVFLWGRWFTPRAMRHLIAGRTYRRRAFLGETVEVTLTLTNQSRLALPWPGQAAPGLSAARLSDRLPAHRSPGAAGVAVAPAVRHHRQPPTPL